MRNTEIMKQQKEQYESRSINDEISNGEQELEVVSGMIDPRLRDEWIAGNKNENSETSQEDDAEQLEVDKSYQESVNLKKS